MFSTCVLCPLLSRGRRPLFVVRRLDPATLFTTFATVPSLSVAIRSSNETLPALSGVSRLRAWPTRIIKSRWSQGSVKVPVKVQSRLKTPEIKVNQGKSRLIFFSNQSASLPPLFGLPGSWKTRGATRGSEYQISIFGAIWGADSLGICNNMEICAALHSETAVNRWTTFGIVLPRVKKDTIIHPTWRCVRPSGCLGTNSSPHPQNSPD
jgi:hypothetical protein